MKATWIRCVSLLRIILPAVASLTAYGSSGGNGGDGAADTADSGSEDCSVAMPESVHFVVTDTMQDQCYDNRGQGIACPQEGEAYNGQDAQHSMPSQSYSTGGFVTDSRTGLMWEQAHHDTRISYLEAKAYCDELTLGDYTDWRIPSIRELFSINDARGNQHVADAFYLDGSAFDFAYPTDVELTGSHTENMMGQTWSSTPRPDNARINYIYNFLDGHIKSTLTIARARRSFVAA
jgi:hypothetical protein